jgi:hypothetical protein
VGNNFDVSTAGRVYYGNDGLGGIIKYVIHFSVVLTIVVLEYKNGYFWQCKFV